MPRYYKFHGYKAYFGSAGAESLLGTEANDMIFAGSGDDLVLGGAGDDLLFGGDGRDILNGGAGDDLLDGGNGPDVMVGGAGNDRLRLGDGDIATGGDDADTFYFDIRLGGEVTIADLDLAEGDSLRLMGAYDMGWTASQGLNHTEITFDNGASIDLYGISLEALMDDPSAYGLF